MAVTHTLNDPITIKLSGPKGEREEVITSITLDLPEDGILRARHLRETDGHSGQVGMTLALISCFSGQPIKVLDELSSADFVALFGMVEDFRKPGQSTGETV